MVTPEMFAYTTCQDFDVPSSAASLIVKQIQDQLAEYRQHHVDLNPEMVFRSQHTESTVIRGTLEDEKDDVWWERWRKRLRTGEALGEFVKSGDEADGDDDEVSLKHKDPGVVKEEAVDRDVIDVDKPRAASPSKEPNEELRILIKVSHYFPLSVFGSGC